MSLLKGKRNRVSAKAEVEKGALKSRNHVAKEPDQSRQATI